MQLPNKNFLSAKLQNLTNSHFQYGFTLLEMVLVLFLIGLLASAGLLFTEGVEDQAKYDETKRRMELIRKAIIGDATRTINGAPEVSGFAADMGRLQDLVTAGVVHTYRQLPIEKVSFDFGMDITMMTTQKILVGISPLQLQVYNFRVKVLILFLS